MFAWEELGMVPGNKLESFGRELQMIPRGILEWDTWLVPLLTQVNSGDIPSPCSRSSAEGDSVKADVPR